MSFWRTLARVTFVDSSAPHMHVFDAVSASAVVTGFGAGDRVMDHVRMSYNFAGRAVIWHGASAKIVSSQFYESGGLWLDATTSEVVNTVLPHGSTPRGRPDRHDAGHRADRREHVLLAAVRGQPRLGPQSVAARAAGRSGLLQQRSNSGQSWSTS